jgi:2-oxoisovalerate dehydrogenase E1 component beta subunit
VPVGDYILPLSSAEIVRKGTDVTLLGYGAQIRVLETVADVAMEEHNISCEVIDLRTVMPWDIATVCASVVKTGRLIVAHEAPSTGGFGAEIAATVHAECFLSMLAPVRRVCGYDTPFPFVIEPQYLPNKERCLHAVTDIVNY